jgi:histidinol phosphatase-like PHP family hydrolase
LLSNPHDDPFAIEDLPTMTVYSRRSFCGSMLAAAGVLTAPADLLAAEGPPQGPNDIPLVDYHVHRDGTTLEKLLDISRRRGVRFGIVEHAGKKENDYPIILTNDDELRSYIASLEGKPVFKGVQAEYLDWMGCFSKEAVAQLDYVLSDAMTIRGPDGRRVKMWSPRFEVGDPQRFMDQYVDFHLEVIASEPIDILANPTWLPKAIEKQYDRLWTPKRIEKIVDAVVKHGVAMEINSLYRIPRAPLLRIAKEAGVKFSFGSNIRGPEVGKLDYCVEMVRALGLKRADIFTPAPVGKKPIQLRRSDA